jgi:serine/threonine protein kinase
MSPYFPVLYKCTINKTNAYCVTEYYSGTNLAFYVSNETIGKTQLKLLLAQIATGLGQLHECNLVYLNLTL